MLKVTNIDKSAVKISTISEHLKTYAPKLEFGNPLQIQIIQFLIKNGFLTLYDSNLRHDWINLREY